MEFSINSKTLTAKLSAAFKAIPQRSPLPILSNFRLSVKDGMLSVCAYDTENMLTVHTPVMSATDGESCVDAQFLLNLVKTLPEVPVTVKTENDICTISSPNGKYTTSAIDTGSFPESEKVTQWQSEFTVACAALNSALSSVSAFTSDDNFHMSLTGVSVIAADGSLTTCGTDTHRLARKIVTLSQPATCSFILPKKAVAIITGNVTGDVTIRQSERFVDVCSGEFSLRSQLIVGNYPDVGRVIPAHSTATLTIDRYAFLSAVRRASVCAGRDFPKVRLNITAECVDVSATDSGMGRNAVERVPCSFSGMPLEIAFNSDFLCDMLSALPSETIECGFTDSSRPCVLTATDTEAKDLTMLLMPLSLS